MALADILAPSGDSSPILYLSRGNTGVVADVVSLDAIDFLSRGNTGTVSDILNGVGVILPVMLTEEPIITATLKSWNGVLSGSVKAVNLRLASDVKGRNGLFL